MDTAYGSFFLLEQVESKTAQDSKIFGSQVFADSTAIFIQSDIQNPMQLIFDRPMFANRVEYSFRITEQVGNKVQRKLRWR